MCFDASEPSLPSGALTSIFQGPSKLRFWAVIISAQMLATVATAQTPPEKAVSILNEVCVAPNSSEAVMAAGEKTAAQENWKLIRSGPVPTPFMHNENGVKNSFISVWEFNLPGGSRARLHVSVLRPEPSDFKYTVCLIQPDIDLDSDDLTQSIDHQFGSAVTKDMSGRFKDVKRWFFVAEQSRGNCGKEILVALHQLSQHGQPKTLEFTDIVYPREWPAAELTRCPN
jgi:hypothetical protein